MNNYTFDIINFWEGDNASFKYIFDENVSKLIFFLTKIMKLSTCEAEDCISDSMIILYEKRNQIKSLQHAKNMMFRCCRYFAIHITQHKKMINRRLPSIKYHFNPVPINPVNIENKEFVSKIYVAIDRLPDKWKEIIYLHYYRGMSIKEIAKKANYCPNNLRKQMRLCHAYLMEIISGNEVNIEDYIVTNSIGTKNNIPKNTKISKKTALEIKKLLEESGGKGVTALAEKFNICRDTVTRIKFNKLALLNS